MRERSPCIHAVKLRDGLVRFVDEHQEVAREIIEQRGRRLAGQTSGEVARVVFDAVAVAHGLDHFEIEHRALVNSLRFDQSSLLFEFDFPPVQFFVDGLDGRSFGFVLHHVVRFRIDGQADVRCLTVPKSGSIWESDSISSPHISMR